MESTWDLNRYAALMAHWSREGPPAYISVAAYLGLRRTAKQGPGDLEGADLVNFLHAFPGGEHRSPGS